MLAVTDADFMVFARLLTAHTQLWTEMVVDSSIIFSKRDGRLDQVLLPCPVPGPVVCQLGGCSPELLSKAADVVVNLGYNQELNLNCGCPSPLVAGKREFGAALMLKPTVVWSCLTSMKAAVGADVRVSLKTRLGVDNHDSEEFFQQFLTAAVPQGPSYSVVVHARKAFLNGLSPEQNRKIPPLNYDRAIRVLGSTDRPWALNGGVTSLDAVRSILTVGHKGLQGVMVGRAVTADPCGLLGVADTKIFGERSNPETAYSRRTILMAYAEYLHDRYPPLPEVNDHTKSKRQRVPSSTVKPVIHLFTGMDECRKWRQTIESLTRTAACPADVIMGAMEAMEEVWSKPLDRPLVDGPASGRAAETVTAHED